MKKSILLILLLVLVFPFTAEAQCSMCRAVLETQGDQSAAEGINNGIMYLMIFPYVLMGGIGYFIYRTIRGGRKKEEILG